MTKKITGSKLFVTTLRSCQLGKQNNRTGEVQTQYQRSFWEKLQVEYCGASNNKKAKLTKGAKPIKIPLYQVRFLMDTVPNSQFPFSRRLGQIEKEAGCPFKRNAAIQCAPSCTIVPGRNKNARIRAEAIARLRVIPSKIAGT